MKICRLFALLVILASGSVLAAEPAITHVDVFRSGTDGYHTYRIPAIEATADGSLVALAEARKHNMADPGFGKQDIDLVCKRSTDGGLTWSTMKVIEDPGELWSAANPATVVDRDTGRLWLFYLRSKPERSTRTSRPGTDDMQTQVRYSDDNGASWSEPTDLTAVARDMTDTENWRASVVGPGGAIQDSRGRLIAPVWKDGPSAVFTIYSDDHGKTWQRGQLVPGQNVGNEDQLVELADGRILMDIRQIGGAHRWLAASDDGGVTWSKPRAGVSVTRVACAIERFTSKAAGDDRNRILWTGPKGPGRTNLEVRVSYDEGRTFTNERQMSTTHAAYSDMAILKDKSVGVLWEKGVQRGYQYITFTRFGLEFLEPDE